MTLAPLRPPSPSTAAVGATRAQDLGLGVLRMAFGLLMAGHGAQKLFGWFGGRGLDGTATGFDGMGYSPPRMFAGIAGLTEFGAGLMLAAGLFTPLACAGVIGVMVNAIAVHWSAGVYNDGFELPLLYALGAVGIALAGPGRYALDRGRPWGSGGLYYGLGALALGAGGAAVVLLGFKG
ncbi:MAG: DoxX family protein [Sporichthyaceae bacterium]